jgi:hypothetical protein
MASDNSEYLLGQIDGKLDSLTELVRDHVREDRERFDAVFLKLSQHAADINKAKGAKGAILVTAGAVSGAVALVAAAAPYILK